MRIDPDTCTDPVLLAAEVRRLKNVLAADDPWLTDAERKSLEWAILTLANSSSASVGVAMDNVIAAQQLRKLLKRLG